MSGAEPIGGRFREGQPLDPHDLARLLAHERGRLYDELGLSLAEKMAAEDACRLVIADEGAGEATTDG